MTLGKVICAYCKKEYLKDKRHINENIKLGHRFYCSLKCQKSAKYKKAEFICERSSCFRKFLRSPGEMSSHNFCSKSCAAIFNNLLRPKPYRQPKLCVTCNKLLVNRQLKYCSLECYKRGYWEMYPSIHNPDLTIEAIRKFVAENNRIPTKKEYNKYYKPARKYFGTWNKAIQAAGFDPNPVMFANHHIAKDGHKCDSLSEKIIDDFLTRRGVIHERGFPYPEGTYTADFKIGNRLIEFFGLSGEHKRYDQIKRKKKKLAGKYNLKLIEIYPKDLLGNDLAKIMQV